MKILCCNCKVEILQADETALSQPLIGSMFQVKPGMEWDIFAPGDTGNDLVCPLCGWCFHENNTLLTEQGRWPFDVSHAASLPQGGVTSAPPPSSEEVKPINKGGWPKGKKRGKRRPKNAS